MNWKPLSRVVAAVLTSVLVASCAGNAPSVDDAARGSSRDRRERTAATRARGAGATPDDVDLQALERPVPEYEGRGRNLFAFGPDRMPTPEPPPTVATRVTPRPTPPPSPTARPPLSTSTPASNVNVKYAGFLEKTEANGDKEKYAIFLDGNEILAAAEGERVANRFTVVEIGLESVTISTASSGGTQRIPLQAN